MKIYFVILGLLVNTFCSEIAPKYISMCCEWADMNKLFVDWNRATIFSLKTNISSSKDSILKNIYTNRLSAFIAYTEISDKDTINKKSIRYEFLDVLKNHYSCNSNLYIMERVSSGEEVEITNFVLIENDKNNYTLNIYEYVSGKWIQSDIAKSLNLNMENIFKKCFTDFGNGKNKDDITITHISKGVLKYSVYYLYSTIPNSCPLGTVLFEKIQ